MTRTAANFQISGREGGRHWHIPIARLTNLTIDNTLDGEELAANHHPVAVDSRVTGSQMVGTVLSQDSRAGMDTVVVDFTPNVIYRHNVRNVRTYDGGGAEATWGVLNIGDPVYFDASATMPADVFLSTSPLNSAGNANPLFGYVQFSESEGITLPTLVATAATIDVPVSQMGLSVPGATAVVVDSAGIAAGAIDLDHMSANSVDSPQIVAGAVDPAHMAVGADDALASPLLLSIAIAGGAAGTKEITMTRKVRVVDAWVQMNGAGEENDTVTLQWDDGTNPAADITDALATGAAGDTDIVRATELDDDNTVIDVDEALVVAFTDSDSGGDVPAMTVYVLLMPVA